MNFFVLSFCVVSLTNYYWASDVSLTSTSGNSIHPTNHSYGMKQHLLLFFYPPIVPTERYPFILFFLPIPQLCGIPTEHFEIK